MQSRERQGLRPPNPYRSRLCSAPGVASRVLRSGRASPARLGFSVEWRVTGDEWPIVLLVTRHSSHLLMEVCVRVGQMSA